LLLRASDIYSQAYEASKLDAERLCPGKTFTSATGWAPLDRKDSPLLQLENLEKSQENMLDDLGKFQDLLQLVPEAAPKVREDIEYLIRNLQCRTQGHYAQLKGVYEKQMREEAAAGTQ
jgi:hypothetical protein